MTQKRGHDVDVRIGVQHSPRELSLETTETKEAILQAFKDAASGDGLLALSDDRGRSVVVPVEKVSYLEFSGESGRRVAVVSQHRFDRSSKRVLDAVARGGLGRLTSARAASDSCVSRPLTRSTRAIRPSRP